MADKQVVIVGAGPYGLSTAAHLQALGLDPYVLGRPMVFWKESMPKGMILRSELEASNIAAPQKELSMEGFQKTIGREIHEPIKIEDFIAYGEWFQKRVVPNLDTRYVKSISRNGDRFTLTLQDGDKIETRAVVLALGIGFFVARPDEFASLSRQLAPHSSEVTEPSQYRGLRVAVVGKGQSALETAALLHENGADVQVLTRAAALKYLKYPWRRKWFRQLMPGPLKPLSFRIFPPTDLGGFITSRVIADPEKFNRRSPRLQKWLHHSVTRPIGAYWLPRRLQNVKVRTSAKVVSVSEGPNGVTLVLSDGNTTTVDRVVLATGYRVDVSRLDVLDPVLRGQIETSNGYPVLTNGLETSVKGLYMAGVVSEWTLGPTLRFVTGTSNAGPRVASAIAMRLR